MKFEAKEQERIGAVGSFSSGCACFIVWRGWLIREMLINGLRRGMCQSLIFVKIGSCLDRLVKD